MENIVEMLMISESGEKLALRYLLSMDVDGFYGVRIEETGRGEAAEARSLSRDRAEALAFLRTLAENQVTPATLRDVAEDWLCEKYSVWS